MNYDYVKETIESIDYQWRGVPQAVQQYRETEIKLFVDIVKAVAENELKGDELVKVAKLAIEGKKFIP